MTPRSDGYIFRIAFEIPGATEPDEYGIRAGDSSELQDMALFGPDPNGVFDTEFERAAPRYEDAVLSAIHDLGAVFPEARLLEVRPDDLVTLHDIAERTGRTHESVRMLVKGKRGPGGFPAETRGGLRRPKMWRWHEVARWFEEKLGVEVRDYRHAAFLAAVNQLLELRRVVPHAARTPQDARGLASLLPAELTAAR